MAEECCRALYDYQGVGGGEKIQTLRFGAGEIIKILYSGDSGWWEGEINGARGWFPASYVKKVQETDSASTASEDWKECTSENGETYFFNPKTNTTSWSIPSVSDSSDERIVSQSVENSVNSSVNNLHGNNLHLPLTATNIDSFQATSQPTTPHFNEEFPPPPPQSKSLPVTPKTLSPHRQSTRKVSTPSSPSSIDGSSKPRIRMFNGISFPDEKQAKEQNLLQPGKFSYCDYFWSDKLENHNFFSGFSVIYQKILKGKHMCKEMSDLFKAREAIELHYAKSLASLANTVHAAQEEGTLGEAIKQVKASMLVESKIHHELANKLRTEVSHQLLEQRDKEKKELKKLDSSMSDLRKQVLIKYQTAERARQLLLERSKDLENKLNSPKHTKEDVQKARKKSTKQAEDLTHAVEMYNKQREQWFEEMVTSCLTLERHEEARIEKVKSVLFHYSKLLENCNDGSNQTCITLNEIIRKTDPGKDRESWVRKHATGKVRPVDLIV